MLPPPPQLDARTAAAARFRRFWHAADAAPLSARQLVRRAVRLDPIALQDLFTIAGEYKGQPDYFGLEAHLMNSVDRPMLGYVVSSYYQGFSLETLYSIRRTDKRDTPRNHREGDRDMHKTPRIPLSFRQPPLPERQLHESKIDYMARLARS